MLSRVIRRSVCPQRGGAIPHSTSSTAMQAPAPLPTRAQWLAIQTWGDTDEKKGANAFQETHSQKEEHSYQFFDRVERTPHLPFMTDHQGWVNNLLTRTDTVPLFASRWNDFHARKPRYRLESELKGVIERMWHALNAGIPADVDSEYPRAESRWLPQATSRPHRQLPQPLPRPSSHLHKAHLATTRRQRLLRRRRQAKASLRRSPSSLPALSHLPRLLRLQLFFSRIPAVFHRGPCRLPRHPRLRRLSSPASPTIQLCSSPSRATPNTHRSPR
ncbi:hypothetical protein C8Q73DRAFT_720078 [Cubamyces lactineus]|nr:hypothetical protein C8Q73DRAFT_720078 [Cubamyces lactineus]